MKELKDIRMLDISAKTLSPDHLIAINKSSHQINVALKKCGTQKMS